MPPESMTTSPEVPAGRLGSWMPHRGVQVHPTMARRYTDDCSVARKHGPLQVPRDMRKDVFPNCAVKWHLPASKVGCLGPWYKTEILGGKFSHGEELRGPDGNIITVGAERFRCAEVVSQPSSTGTKQKGIHHTSRHNITRCDLETLKGL